MKKVLSTIVTVAIIIGLRFFVNWIFANKCAVCDVRITDTEYINNGTIYCYDCKPAGYYAPQ